jgi:hypothetical protein
MENIYKVYYRSELNVYTYIHKEEQKRKEDHNLIVIILVI